MFAAQIRADWRSAELDPADRAMLTWVEKLTRTPGAMTETDLATLRDAGFDAPAITQIAGIASLFCYLNRMADGLGTGRD